MILVRPSVQLMTCELEADLLERIERSGRVCYKSDSFYTRESGIEFFNKIIARNHMSVLEHVSLSVRVVCNRGVTHEIVRHRIASYSQESTRYCNYKGGVTFVIPCWIDDIEPGEYSINNRPSLSKMSFSSSQWMSSCLEDEGTYCYLLQTGWSPQQARDVLPNCLKTEIVITQNLRSWLHFFNLRYYGTTGAPHPQMKEVAGMILETFQYHYPNIFKESVCERKSANEFTAETG